MFSLGSIEMLSFFHLMSACGKDVTVASSLAGLPTTSSVFCNLFSKKGFADDRRMIDV